MARRAKTMNLANLLPILIVCRLFGVAPLRQASGKAGLVWSVLVILAMVATSIDVLVHDWQLHLEQVTFATVSVQRVLCTWTLALLVARRHRLGDVLDAVLAVADECAGLPGAPRKAAAGTWNAIMMAVFVASDAGLLAWDWTSGWAFYYPPTVIGLQLTHALTKFAFLLFAAQVRLLAEALGDVNAALSAAARRTPSEPFLHSHLRTVSALQALHVRLGCTAEALGAAWGAVLLPGFTVVFTALWGEAAWNVAGALQGLYGKHASFRPSLNVCRILNLFVVLLHAARNCDRLQRQSERTGLLVHGILNREDAPPDQEVSQFAMQLAGSRDRFVMSVCGLFDFNSGLVTGMVNTVCNYLSIQVPITIAAIQTTPPIR